MSIQTLVSKYENKVTLKIKPGYYLELLTPKTLKYLESKGNEMPENVLRLQITKLFFNEILLIAPINMIQEFYIHSYQINQLQSYCRFCEEILFF